MKVLGYILSLIFLGVSLFLWFRGADGSGLANTMQVKLVSLTIWIAFSLIVLAIYLVTYHFIRRRS
ncbi:DUF3923 family protein [Holzapfeliella sp. JNUCC 72]